MFVVVLGVHIIGVPYGDCRLAFGEQLVHMSQSACVHGASVGDGNTVVCTSVQPLACKMTEISGNISRNKQFNDWKRFLENPL